MITTTMDADGEHAVITGLYPKTARMTKSELKCALIAARSSSRHARSKDERERYGQIAATCELAIEMFPAAEPA